MKILILSFYFRPDLCAGSFRCSALVEQLKQQPGIDIEVITTRPNRYASYSAEALEFESEGGVAIHRIALPEHHSGMLDQVRAFMRYYREARALVKNQQYDMVYATSSRLFTAFLGAKISADKQVPLYLDIRDIFVDTIKDVLSPVLACVIKPIFSLVEGYSFRRASKINLVSRGFAGYFQARHPKAELSWFTNGIDNEFLIKEAKPEVHKADREGMLQILYAGNLGEGQGLHFIVPKMAKVLAGKAEITIIGDGGRKPQLLAAIEAEGVKNVFIVDPLPRSELISRYLAADVLFLHLNDYPAFKKVLPSKIFEYAALGKPILAGVAGYAADFLTSEVENAEVFNPGWGEGAAEALERLSLQDINRDVFIEKYRRDEIMKCMAEDIVGLLPEQ